MLSHTHPAGCDETAHLERFQKEIRDCRRCPLSESRSRVVFGTGRCDASVMFVGEAPGRHEDAQGIPFVGAAGQLLGRLLEAVGMRREDVYITNVNKCRPPDNRTPTGEEIAACRPYLERQIEIVRPRVLCTLGNNATRALLGKPVSISKVRGRPFHVDGHFIFPMFHPAAALHLGSRMDDVRDDFRGLKEFLGTDPVPDPRAEQMGLF